MVALKAGKEPVDQRPERPALPFAIKFKAPCSRADRLVALGAAERQEREDKYVERDQDAQQSGFHAGHTKAGSSGSTSA